MPFDPRTARRVEMQHTFSAGQGKSIEQMQAEAAQNLRSAPGKLAQGVAAGIVGAPVDIASGVLRAFNLATAKPVMGSEWLGEKLGADTKSASFIAGTALPVSPSDLAVPLAKAGAAGLGVLATGMGVLHKLGAAPVASKFRQSGMFVGKGASVWDAAKATEAEKLEALGKTPEEIWKATGTFRGADKIWRQEIPDDMAKFKGAMPSWARLGSELPISESYSHPKLYEAYPDVAQLKLAGNEPTAAGQGSYSEEAGKIFVDAAINPKHQKAISSTTLHEVQHAIQAKEGWARGGSPEEFNQAAQAKIAADALSWKRELLRQKAKYPEADMTALENAAVQEYQQIGAMDMLPSREARDLAAQPFIFYGEKNYPEQLKQIENLVAAYGLHKRATPYTPFEGYKRLAGEAEARLTEARRLMTAEQRAASFPPSMLDVPMSEQTVRLRNEALESSVKSAQETMPTSVLATMRDVDRNLTPKSNKELADITNSIKKEGIKKPVTVTVSTADNMAYITDGNTRVTVANNLGVKDVPVKFEKTDVPFTTEQRAKAQPLSKLGINPASIPDKKLTAAEQADKEELSKLLGTSAEDLVQKANQLPYQIQHKPMSVEGGASQLHDLTTSFGDDVYGKHALEYFGSGDDREKATLRVLQSLRGKPDAQVTIYRGAPLEAGKINPGDWVTLDKRVAQDYVDLAKDNEGKAGKVYEMRVPASHITAWPDSLLEFGYFPPSQPTKKFNPATAKPVKQ